MTPYETVLASYRFPEYIIEHPLQVETINELAPLNNSGEWLSMGCGKTLVSTACALYSMLTNGGMCLVIMPPNLLTQWAVWLESIRPRLSICVYRGTPAERKRLHFNHQFVLVGIQIFKRDFARFEEHYTDRRFVTIVDEATMLSGIESNTHHKVLELCVGQQQILLSGTPANKPTDAYGLLKFTAPGTYRNLKHFENTHVDEKDFFDQVTRYKNLDLLHKNLLINSKRILLEDMFSETEDPLFIPINYELDPKHYKLYRKLAEEELLALPDGSKIDGTTANRLRHALGQIIVNHGHFSGDPADTSEAVKLIEEKLFELGQAKLVVFADYRLTVAVLTEKLKKYGAVPYNGAISDAQKERNKQLFINSPSCRVIVIQFVSGGKGLDGLQHVCHHAMFIEPCLQPRDFHQCVARLRRIGQKYRVLVMLAIAKGTTQVRGFKNLLANDELINQVVRNTADLRKLIYGE